MSTSPVAAALRNDLGCIRGKWLPFLLLGIALIVVGTIALGTPMLLGMTTVLLIGIMMLTGGIIEAVGSFWTKEWSGFFLVLLSGIIHIIVGLLFIRRPGATLAGLTLLIGAFLMVGGLFKIIGSVALRFPSWGWVLLSGAISLALGIMIWQEWPASAVWVIGLFVGIEMIFAGWNWVILGLELRRLPKVEA